MDSDSDSDYNHEYEVRRALGRVADVNATSIRNGNTLLMEATRKGNVSAVYLLLGHPEIEVNKTNDANSTALHFACAYGSPNMVRRFLQVPGIECDVRNDPGNTPLMRAVQMGQVENARVMLALTYLDMDTVNEEGESLEEVARGDISMLAVLKEARRVRGEDWKECLVNSMREELVLEATEQETITEIQGSYTEGMKTIRKGIAAREESVFKNKLQKELNEFMDKEEAQKEEFKLLEEEAIEKLKIQNRELLQKTINENLEREKAAKEKSRRRIQLKAEEVAEGVKLKIAEQEELLELLRKKQSEEEGAGLPPPPPGAALPDCPVCMESLAPPTRVHQCAKGHLICGHCKPSLQECPSRCGAPLLDDPAYGMEALLRSLAGL